MYKKPRKFYCEKIASSISTPGLASEMWTRQNLLIAPTTQLESKSKRKQLSKMQG